MIKMQDTSTLPQVETMIIAKRSDKDIIIIGAGPAGLTAGIYAMRMGMNATLIEKAVCGGLAAVTDRVENYPGFPGGVKGMDLTAAFEAQAKELGLLPHWDTVNSVEVDGKTIRVICDEKSFEAKALIVASGTQLKKLGIPGENEFLGRGVSYCATCDAPFYKGKKVIVVGGGNSALEEALFLTNFAETVTVVHRRNALRADKILELRARANPKIYFMWDSVIEKIEGKDPLEAVSVKNTKTGKLSRVSVDGVFIFIGYTPHTAFLKGLLKTDQSGFILADEKMRTSVDGIFAAGDVRSKDLRQIVTAASDGAIAAANAYAYLEGLKK